MKAGWRWVGAAAAVALATCWATWVAVSTRSDRAVVAQASTLPWAAAAGRSLAAPGPFFDPARPEEAGTVRLSPASSFAPNPGDFFPSLLPGERVPRPEHVHGIYLTGWIAGIPRRFGQLVDLVDSTSLNAMVIDVKDDEGTITYKTHLPLGLDAGPQTAKVADPDRLLATLQQHRIYSIARVVTFKDQVWPRLHPELAVHRPDGSVFHDRAGFMWLSPYEKRVWEYNLAIAKDAAARGFSEIQFDYVRFPDIPKSLALSFPGQDERTKAEVIRDFLAYARRELAPYGVKVSADIFGLVTTVKDDLGIGQHLEDVASAVDWVSPMAYPSHYARGEFGLTDPDAVPYETVYLSLRDAVRRLREARLEAKVVPWLQDFSLRHAYGEEQVLAQVKAASDLGIEDWYLWNPRNRYTEAALRRLGR